MHTGTHPASVCLAFILKDPPLGALEMASAGSDLLLLSVPVQHHVSRSSSLPSGAVISPLLSIPSEIN